jgi:glyoxalase/bleomycin resistance protein/dioxygenase superfamily protein
VQITVLARLYRIGAPAAESAPPEEKRTMAAMRLRVELFVTDLSTSTRFYTGILGFQLGRRADD